METLVFDLDGTLIEIGGRDYRVYADTLSEKGFIPLKFSEYWPLRRARTNIRNILSLSDCDSDLFFSFFLAERQKRIEQEDYLSLDRPFPETTNVLYQLRRLYACRLVTARHNIPATERQLKRLDLYDLFSSVHIVQESKRETFNQIESVRFIIGDTENDIVPAQACGIPVIGITTGIRDKKTLSSFSPDYVIDRLSEIYTLIP